MTSTFKDFNLAPEVQQTLDTLGFTEPTEIQAKSLPILLGSKKVDFHGQAQTGTGKTLAFGLPLLHRIDRSQKITQGLVVAPTRELALQIVDSLRPFAKALGISIEPIYGGVSMEDQLRALKRGAQIVVGTPGRLNDHLRRKTLDISHISTLVLDEADIMLDMGFKEEVDDILYHTPPTREIWLFSATVKPGINTIMHEHMHEPVSVRVSKKTSGTPATKQYYCIVPARSRLNALCRFIECAPDFYGFIFCQTKILTSEIAEQLIRRGYQVGALHGDMSQSQRNAMIKRFKSKDITIVVATDVAARGIDIANLTHVINYSVPEDLESYVHRIGRTGRAGKEGIAITFVNKSDLRVLQAIQRKFNLEIKPLPVPSREEIIQGRVQQAALYLTTLTGSHLATVHAAFSHLVSELSEQQLRESFAKMLEEKFLTSIMEEEDIAPAPSYKHAINENIQELFIPVGLDDNIQRSDIVKVLTATGLIQEDQIHKIHIIKRRTFIEVPSELVHQLITALAHESLYGRRLRAHLVEEEQPERYRRPSGDRRGRDRIRPRSTSRPRR